MLQENIEDMGRNEPAAAYIRSQLHLYAVIEEASSDGRAIRDK